MGVKTIIVDNAHAIKPFGAIDTPTQGGTASGSDFINWGWVLTPQPNQIPTDGSTINVWVDGVNLGHPTYNIYRKDIAELFPGYANSNGAAGYFYIDTTVFENGLHTIQWTATDNAGNEDGIGSRYFTIENGCGTITSTGLSRKTQETPLISMETLNELPMDNFEPVTIKKGYQAEQDIHWVFPNNDGISVITIKELERLEIQVSTASSEIYGYLVVGNTLKGLPVGSFLDGKSGIFYWQPGPGFVGDYDFVFIEKKPNGEMCRRNISVEILPKFEN